MILLMVLCLYSSGCASRPAAPPAGSDIVAGNVLLGLRDDFVTGPGFPAALAAALAAPGATVAGGFGEVWIGGVQAQVLRALYGEADRAAGLTAVVLLRTAASDAATTQRDLTLISGAPGVAWAEPDARRRLTDITPNDARYPEQGDLPQVRMPPAWGIVEGVSGRAPVSVAVLDTGVLPAHPDLQASLWRRRDGTIDGYNFVSVGPDGQPVPRSPDPTDPGNSDDLYSSGLHGTHVTGTVGATANNMIGIAGVCWECRILAVRVLGVGDAATMTMGGTGTDSDIVDGLRWSIGAQVGSIPVTEHPAQVVNLSFGGPSLSFSVKQAIDEAIHQGVSVAAAAGNNGEDPVNGAADQFFPGGLDNVISVGSADESGQRSSFSSYGPRVDLLAPGENILSTYRTDDGTYDYDILTGTSQATPHVSGAVGLVKSLWPQASPAQVVDLLWETADASKRCDDDPQGGCGAGLLDVATLVQVAAAQATCTCTRGQYCLSGSCRTPVARHVSVLATEIIQPGCAAAPSRRGQATSWPLQPLVLLALWFFLTRSRRLYYIPAADWKNSATKKSRRTASTSRSSRGRWTCCFTW